jgi:hypothetical protein
MKIIINNTEFSYNIGCKLLKAKYRECPKWFNQPEIWDDIVPITFKEIASVENIEHRRIAISCIGLENLVKEVQPNMIGSETIKKRTTFVKSDGGLETINFEDTYKLFEVSGKSLGLTDRENRNFHYVQCKDTSTDREYLIWVDATSVYQTSSNYRGWTTSSEDYGKMITPIQAIAWTIQTNIEKGGIEKLIRQGDCILIKKNNQSVIGSTRHLTEEEYKELLVLES